MRFELLSIQISIHITCSHNQVEMTWREELTSKYIACLKNCKQSDSHGIIRCTRNLGAFIIHCVRMTRIFLSEDTLHFGHPPLDCNLKRQSALFTQYVFFCFIRLQCLRPAENEVGNGCCERENLLEPWCRVWHCGSSPTLGSLFPPSEQSSQQ